MLISTIALIALAGAGCSSTTATYSNTNAGTPSTPTVTGQTQTVSVNGGMFYFDPKEIRVKQGATVTVAFKNLEGTHNFVLDEFGARTPVINAGESASITFVANKTGTFEYYCSVANHRAMGMVGKLIVE